MRKTQQHSITFSFCPTARQDKEFGHLYVTVCTGIEQTESIEQSCLFVCTLQCSRSNTLLAFLLFTPNAPIFTHYDGYRDNQVIKFILFGYRQTSPSR